MTSGAIFGSKFFGFCCLVLVGRISCGLLLLLVACWRVVLVLVRDIHVIAPILIQTTNSPTTTHTHTHTRSTTHTQTILPSFFPSTCRLLQHHFHPQHHHRLTTTLITVRSNNRHSSKKQPPRRCAFAVMDHRLHGHPQSISMRRGPSDISWPGVDTLM